MAEREIIAFPHMKKKDWERATGSFNIFLCAHSSDPLPPSRHIFPASSNYVSADASERGIDLNMRKKESSDVKSRSEWGKKIWQHQLRGYKRKIWSIAKGGSEWIYS